MAKDFKKLSKDWRQSPLKGPIEDAMKGQKSVERAFVIARPFITRWKKK